MGFASGEWMCQRMPADSTTRSLWRGQKAGLQASRSETGTVYGMRPVNFAYSLLNPISSAGIFLNNTHTSDALAQHLFRHASDNNISN